MGETVCPGMNTGLPGGQEVSLLLAPAVRLRAQLTDKYSLSPQRKD